MKIWGVNSTGLEFALAMGNANFAGNIKFDRCVKINRRHVIRLAHRDAGPGSKISIRGNGRKYHGPSVCWHAHRDFIRAVFDINPTARVKTAFADYRSKEDFEAKCDSTKYGRCECPE